MAQKLTFLPLAAILAVGSLAHAANGDQIQGTWSPDGGKQTKIEIQTCGNTYCGAIVWMRMPHADDKNVGPKMRSRPLDSARILTNTKFESGQTWVGKLYSPENGKVADAKLVLVNKSTLEITEKFGDTTKSVVWKRVVE